MYKILDRLMARQRRLLEQLDSDTSAQSAKPPVDPAALTARAEAEAQALEQADRELESGNMAAAKELLEPFVEGATIIRTLSVLARIHVVAGTLDDALSLLKRAEALDPTDRKLWRLLAETCAARGDHLQEVQYRRKLAFVDAGAPAQAFVDLVRALHKSTSHLSKVPTKEMRLASVRIEGAAEFTPDSRARFAEALFAVGTLTSEARAHYAAAQPCSHAEYDVTAKWTRMFDWCERSGMPLTRWLEGGVPAHRPAIAELRDVLVFPHFQWVPVVDEGRVALTGFLMHRIRQRSEDPATPLLMYNKQEAELRIPKQMRIVDGPALLVGGTSNYYHNTVEFLSTLAISDTLDKGRDLPLVVNDDLAQFQIEQLALLGYPPDRLIRVKHNEPVRFTELMVPSRLVQGGRWMDPLIPRWYRSRLGIEMGSMPTRRLYLSQVRGDRGRISNSDDLVKLMDHYGFEVVTPEELSFEEQVKLFTQASHIVGAAGVAFTNMLFAPPGASIVILYNRSVIHGGHDLYYDALATACGHAVSILDCTPTHLASGRPAIDADLIVDIGRLRNLLQ